MRQHVIHRHGEINQTMIPTNRFRGSYHTIFKFQSNGHFPIHHYSTLPSEPNVSVCPQFII